MSDHPRFIVWSPTGPTSPRVTHQDHTEARRAAESMARLHRGQKFYVCELVDVYESVEVRHVDLRAERKLTEASESAPIVGAGGVHAASCRCRDCVPF